MILKIINIARNFTRITTINPTKMFLTKCLNHTLSMSKKHNLTRITSSPSRLYKTSEKEFFETLIINNTVVSNDHLTPELKLRLITPECDLWHCKSSESKFPDDPFWGIYWPGGQALGRYILDNQTLFKQKNVLDIGSGSGACAVAAAKCGAKCILANDIDPVSLIGIKINTQLNNVTVHVNQNNLIGENIDELTIIQNNKVSKPVWDIVLIGDMFYDSEFSKKLFVWLCKLVNQGKVVLVGDPGRHALKELDNMRDIGTITKIAEYSLKNHEHNGFSEAAVYKVLDSSL